MISSISAMRGMPRNITTYAASKAAVAHLAEGFRADVMGTPIKVTVLYPGYIVSEMSATSKATPLVASTERGVRSMVDGHREGEGLGTRARLAVGAGGLRAQAPAPAGRPAPDGLRRRPGSAELGVRPVPPGGREPPVATLALDQAEPLELRAATPPSATGPSAGGRARRCAGCRRGAAPGATRWGGAGGRRGRCPANPSRGRPTSRWRRSRCPRRRSRRSSRRSRRPVASRRRAPRRTGTRTGRGLPRGCAHRGAGAGRERVRVVERVQAVERVAVAVPGGGR